MALALEGERLVIFRLKNLRIGRICEWQSERGFRIRVRRMSQEVYIVRIRGRIVGRIQWASRHADVVAQWIKEFIWRPLWTILLPAPKCREGQPVQLLLPGFGYGG